MEDGSPEVRQQIIKTLDTDGGYLRIKELLDLANPTSMVLRSNERFLEAVLPFMGTVSHQAVVSSPMLETHIDNIHNYIYGSGQRAISTFATIARLIDTRVERGEALNAPDPANDLVCVLAVLRRMVDLCGDAILQTQLRDTAAQFIVVIDKLPEIFGFQRDSARELLRKVMRRLELGNRLRDAQTNCEQDETTVPQKLMPKFETGKDLPGRLSRHGPRHDNDHHHIKDIAILPTALEIASDRAEYLPVMDPSRLHLKSMEGLLDRQFRLLREDTVGQLRDAVRTEIQRLQNLGSKLDRKGIRVFSYHGVKLERINFDKSGLSLLVSFSQPFSTKPGSKMHDLKERQSFWESSKCLKPDSLLCLVHQDGSATFMTVQGDHKQSKGRPRALFENSKRATIALRLTDPHELDIRHVYHCFLTELRQQQVLCEFPGVLLPAFYHTLNALKSMSRSADDVPFSDLIAPTGSGLPTIGLPRYATATGFSFDMSSLVEKGEDLILSPSTAFDFATLERNSTLDAGQQSAIVHALTHRLALVRGPPGTGKSFTGVAMVRTLLANRPKGKLGPIICVCYTNHALDAMLEGLHGAGVKQIIRIGGQSKSELLKPLNLREVAMSIDATPSEKRRRWEAHTMIEGNIAEINKLLPVLRNPGGWGCLKHYLLLNHRSHYEELLAFEDPRTDEEGFTTVDYDNRKPLEKWLKPKSASAISVDAQRTLEELQELCLNEMSILERHNLLRHWRESIVQDVLGKIERLTSDFAHGSQSLQRLRSEQDLRCLANADVIGMTTTGLARNLDLVRRSGSKVLVCEEAGEVLEAHMLTALLPTLEHCILIGDHEQLRPQIQNYDLQTTNPRGFQYSLDVSLFERLVKPLIPSTEAIGFSSLNIQRRMHPSISDLVRKTIYPELKDHASVQHHPLVAGLTKRLFWLDHSQPETESEFETSHSNTFEVEMTTSLVSHIVRQGCYRSEDIVVLTPYLGQLLALRRALASSFAIVIDDKDTTQIEQSGLNYTGTDSEQESSVSKSTLLKALRIATVDNFQGEEAKVVIISLVRSNPANKCGFLRTTNRINVLLR